MSSESSPDDISNAMTRLNARLDSDEGEEPPVLVEPPTESPQNMQAAAMAYCRMRRALTFACDEEGPSVPTASHSRAENPAVASGSRPPSNSVNSFHLEARPQGNVAVDNAPPHRPPVATYNWQGSKTTMRERFTFLFNNQILSDVSFLVGRGAQQQRIPAHKLVLSSGSAVFDAMFNGTLATSSAEIEVPDIEPAAFLAVLLFLYTDEIQIDPETVMTTLYTAKKYAVSPLEKHCVDFLRNNLTSDNAFLLLTQARLFDEPQLAAVCLDTIDKFTTDALNADGFTDVDIDTLMVVLERDTLRVRESKIFHAVVRWSEAECGRQQLPITPENQRSVLGRALSLVRFPLMTVEEFAGGPAQSGLLTDREVMIIQIWDNYNVEGAICTLKWGQVLQLESREEYKKKNILFAAGSTLIIHNLHEVVSVFLYFTVNPKPSVGFEAMPRCCMMGKEQTVCRFQQTDKRWGYSGTSDRIRFSVDRRIFLVGYGVYGSIHGPAEYDVQIELIHTASGKVIATNNTSFSCDGSRYTYRLMFKEPAEILPNTIYTASAMFKGPDSHYGSKGLRKVTVDCGSGDGKVKFQFSYAAGNNNGSSVEDGQIPELIFYT